MSYVETTSPTLSDATTIAKVRSRLNIASGARDDEIQELVNEAIALLKSECRRYALTTAVTQRWYGTPKGQEGLLIRGVPVASVSEVRVILAGGTEVVNAAKYRVDTDREPAVLLPPYGEAWSLTAATTIYGIEADLSLGYGTTWSDFPPELRQGLRELVVYKWEYPAPVGLGTITYALPHGLDSWLSYMRVGDEFTNYERPTQWHAWGS